MNYQVGDIIVGTVSKVRPYALFLSFDKVNGLLHISEISDKYIRDIEKFATVGDEIKVKVLTIDPDNGFLRVSFKQVEESERYCSHDSTIKRVPEVANEEFKDLEENLPKWINETLEKARNKND